MAPRWTSTCSWGSPISRYTVQLQPYQPPCSHFARSSICLSRQKLSMTMSHDTETDLTQQQGGCKRAEVSVFAMHVDLVNICCCAAVTNGSDGIVKEFHEALQRSPDTAVAVAAIKVQCQLPPNHLTWQHQVQSLRLLKSAKLSNQHPTVCWVYDCNRYPTLHCRK